jgi:hypothetical protein
MIAAVGRFCELVGSTDCIVTNDGHPAVIAFQNGASFQEALRVAEREGEGEVNRVEDLYIDKGYADDLAYRGPDGKQEAIPVWDTHGYWRFRSVL